MDLNTSYSKELSSDDGKADAERLDDSTSSEDTDSEGISSDDNSPQCPVCLISFYDQDIGTPESCDHSFCLDCIKEWAKNVNTCPIDRQPFNIIFARHEVGGEIFDRVQVENSSLPSTEDPTFCEVCGLSDREDRLLLCDGCDSGYHLDCLDPPLITVPVEEWFCPECISIRRHGRQPTITSGVESLSQQSPSDTEHHDDDEVQPTRQLQIPRTLVNRRVLRRIEDRLNWRIESSESSSEDDDYDEDRQDSDSMQHQEDTKEAVAVSAASASGKLTRRSLSTAGTSPKKTSRRHKRKKRRTKSSKCRSGATAGVKGKRRRRRKGGKRRKMRSTKRRAVDSAANLARVVGVPTVKGRLAGRLGLFAPPLGQTIPLVRRPVVAVQKLMDVQREELGDFSVFGSKIDLYAYGEDGGNCPPVQVRSAPQQFASALLAGAGAAANPSTAASLDLLGSILQGQRLLTESPKNIVINHDGSLQIKPDCQEPPLPSSAWVTSTASGPGYLTDNHGLSSSDGITVTGHAGGEAATTSSPRASRFDDRAPSSLSEKPSSHSCSAKNEAVRAQSTGKPTHVSLSPRHGESPRTAGVAYRAADASARREQRAGIDTVPQPSGSTSLKRSFSDVDESGAGLGNTRQFSVVSLPKKHPGHAEIGRDEEKHLTQWSSDSRCIEEARSHGNDFKESWSQSGSHHPSRPSTGSRGLDASGLQGHNLEDSRWQKESRLHHYSLGQSRLHGRGLAESRVPSRSVKASGAQCHSDSHSLEIKGDAGKHLGCNSDRRWQPAKSVEMSGQHGAKVRHEADTVVGANSERRSGGDRFDVVHEEFKQQHESRKQKMSSSEIDQRPNLTGLSYERRPSGLPDHGNGKLSKFICAPESNGGRVGLPWGQHGPPQGELHVPSPAVNCKTEELHAPCSAVHHDKGDQPSRNPPHNSVSSNYGERTSDSHTGSSSRANVGVEKLPSAAQVHALVLPKGRHSVSGAAPRKTRWSLPDSSVTPSLVNPTMQQYEPEQAASGNVVMATREPCASAALLVAANTNSDSKPAVVRKEHEPFTNTHSGAVKREHSKLAVVRKDHEPSANTRSGAVKRERWQLMSLDDVESSSRESVLPGFGRAKAALDDMTEVPMDITDDEQDSTEALCALKLTVSNTALAPHPSQHASKLRLPKPPDSVVSAAPAGCASPLHSPELRRRQQIQEKLMKQRRIEGEVKIVLKPSYMSGQISKDDYKEIMRKAVCKIYSSKSGSIDPAKVKAFVERYISKVVALQQHSKSHACWQH